MKVWDLVVNKSLIFFAILSILIIGKFFFTDF